ncbi:MAG: HlyD family efflux transporter periplasmic adaptor subunit [Fuerstiella sp.]|nr:HlyD family efflux transporter periplasmic adaptor subunit [Fuerstiella sp.]MCP4505785.1 HlyD family efflux transporter periplasmic adaptor subunit [Fuerstiella sp.]
MNNTRFPRCDVSARRATRSGSVRGIVSVVLAMLCSVAAWKIPATHDLLAGIWQAEPGDLSSKYILHKADIGSFRITITENGTVDSSQNSTLTNSVEGTTTIISIVPEGSRVNGPVVSEIDGVVEYVNMESEAERSLRVRSEDGEEKLYEFSMTQFTEILVKDRQQIKAGDYLAGDMVCELDSSSLEEAEKQQQITVTMAGADLKKAETNLKIQETTNESVLAQAKLNEELAQLTLEEYASEGGKFEQLVGKAQGSIKGFEEELAISKEEYDKMRDQARRGYENLNKLETARVKVIKNLIALKQSQQEFNVLEKFEYKRESKKLEQEAKNTVGETVRVALEGEAAMAQMEADHDARKLTMQVEEEKLERLIRQIKACRLIASQQGEVVYAGQQSRRSEPVVIEEGATVRERQGIINLPDLDQMKIDARIHESRISRIVIGQPVEISIDALPTILYHGVLETVSSVPVPGSWPNTDLKEYEAGITITDSPELVRQLKPGMTAEIRIIVDDREEDVLQIPVQSVLSLASKFYTFVATGSEVERRELKVGDANDEYMEIIDGVAEGDTVVMNPRTHFSREINELEVRLLGDEEDARPRVAPPEPAAGGGAKGKSGAKGKGGAKGKSAGARKNAGGGGMPDPKAMFDGLDKNKDGAITKDENELRGNFAKYDKDGDGRITPEELKQAFANR